MHVKRPLGPHSLAALTEKPRLVQRGFSFVDLVALCRSSKTKMARNWEIDCNLITVPGRGCVLKASRTRHEFYNFHTEVTRGRRRIAIPCAHHKARRDHRMMSLAGPNLLDGG